MTFSDFCEHSKKLNRIIANVSCWIIAGVLTAALVIKSPELETVKYLLDKWLPILMLVMVWLFKTDTK